MPNIILDAAGKPTEVMLTVKEYRALLQRLEDLEDALELREARKHGGTFEELHTVLKRLKLESS